MSDNNASNEIKDVKNANGEKPSSSFGKSIILVLVLVASGVLLLVPRLAELLGKNSDNAIVTAVNEQADRLNPGELAPDVSLPVIGLGDTAADPIEEQDVVEAQTDTSADTKAEAGTDPSIAEEAGSLDASVDSEIVTDDEIGVTRADGETPGEDILGSDVDPDEAARALLAANKAAREAEERAADATEASNAGTVEESETKDAMASETVDTDAANGEVTDEISDDVTKVAESTVDEDAIEKLAELTDENAALAKRIDDLQNELNAAKLVANQGTTSVAVTELRLRLAKGEPIDEIISELAEANVEVPDALRQAGQDTPSLDMLREEYPSMAHNALRSSIKATQGDDWYDGITTLVKSEFAGRSVTPQEGNDPNAVLSRVEDALRSGDLQAVIGEVSLLPSEAQEALMPWIEKVQQRLTVTQAVDELAAQAN